MGEILQESEKYIIQWWDLDDNKRGFQTCMDYEDAVQRIKQYKQNDKLWGDHFKYRIVKEITRQEVVYDKYENQD